MLRFSYNFELDQISYLESALFLDFKFIIQAWELTLGELGPDTSHHSSILCRASLVIPHIFGFY